MNDPRLHAVREALAAYAADADDPPVTDEDVIQAAVSVILRAHHDDVDLLLIKRAHNPRDPWSGHMALPGGRRDAADESLLDTAVRETMEETAVKLSPDRSRGFLGSLPRVMPSSPRLPRLTIAPYVFGVPADTEARVASREVDRVHWVSLGYLRDPGTAGTVEIDLPGGPRSFPCLRVDDEVVWGLTYRILVDLFQRFPDPLGVPG